MVKEIFSKYEKGVLFNLCIDGIKTKKEVLKSMIDDADCKEIWEMLEREIISIREAQCFIEKLNPRNSPKP